MGNKTRTQTSRNKAPLPSAMKRPFFDKCGRIDCEALTKTVVDRRIFVKVAIRNS